MLLHQWKTAMHQTVPSLPERSRRRYAHWCCHGSQGKPAIFWFKLGTNFSGSEPIYFQSQYSEWFKIKCADLNGTCSMLVETGVCDNFRIIGFNFGLVNWHFVVMPDSQHGYPLHINPPHPSHPFSRQRSEET